MKKKKADNDSQSSRNTELSLDDKKTRLNELVHSMRKTDPESIIGFATDKLVSEALDYEKLPTGIPQLDENLDGGIPSGKFSVFTGRSQTGKSSMAYQVIGYNQQENPDAIWLIADIENSYDSDWVKSLGIDESRLLFAETDIMEDVLQKVIDLARTGCLQGILIDSIGALLPRAEVEAPASKAGVKPKERNLRQENVAVLNRKIGQFYRMANKTISHYNTAAILIAHVYTDINSMGHGEKLVTKGGNATKHFAHMRLGFRRAYDKDKEVMVRMPDGREKKVISGFDSVITVEKTKQGAHEGHQVYIPFTFGVGFDSKQCTINAAFASGVIEQAGAWYKHPKFPEGKLQGKKNVVEYIMKNEEVYEEFLNDMIVLNSGKKEVVKSNSQSKQKESSQD
jgi:recombination protein RecA